MNFLINKHTGEFQAGAIVNENQFPAGVDFERLIRLGAITPQEGGFPTAMGDSDAGGWKARAEALEAENKTLYQKLADNTSDDAAIEFETKIDELAAENAALKDGLEAVKAELEAAKAELEAAKVEPAAPTEPEAPEAVKADKAPEAPVKVPGK